MQGNPFKFILFLVIAGAVMFLVFRPFAYAIAMALAITLVILTIYYSVRGISSLARRFRLRNTLEGIIEDKISAIHKQMDMLDKDLLTIATELQDIEQQLTEEDLSNFASDKLIRLRNAFEIEKDLKQEKLNFYQLTSEKFRELLSDQQVLKKISSKKEKLKQVRNESDSQEPTSNDHLSSNKEVIEELDYLTLRMDNTVHIDEAKDIRKELVTMYR